MSKPSPSEAGRQAEPDGSTKSSKTLVTVKPSDVILTSEEEDAAIRDMDEVRTRQMHLHECLCHGCADGQ